MKIKRSQLKKLVECMVRKSLKEYDPSQRIDVTSEPSYEEPEGPEKSFEIIGRLGNPNPIENGGGVVIKMPDGYGLEYTEGEELGYEDVSDLAGNLLSDMEPRLTVYKALLFEEPKYFFEYYDWVEWDDFMKYSNRTQEQLDEEVKTIMGQAKLLEDIAEWDGGWGNIDDRPWRGNAGFSPEGLRKRWELKKATNESVNEDYIKLPNINPEEYPERSGLEGPFRFRSGHVLYYDPREGKYYDAGKDMYLDKNDLIDLL